MGCSEKKKTKKKKKKIEKIIPKRLLGAEIKKPELILNPGLTLTRTTEPSCRPFFSVSLIGCLVGLMIRSEFFKLPRGSISKSLGWNKLFTRN